MGSRSIFSICWLVCTGALADTAVAQESDPSAVEADTIIVTGQGLREAPSVEAYDSIVINRDTLVSTASGRIEDALSDIAGFQQFRRSDSRTSNPSAQGATLRALGGNATSRALVLLDGVPISDPFFGYIPFSAIAPERLSQVRVTRGGGSGPFGAGALAGTIELSSAQFDQLDPVSLGLLASDREDTEATLTLAPRLGSGFATISGRWDRGRGVFTTPPSQRVEATARAAYDSWSLFGRGVAPLADGLELQARILTYDDARTLRFEGADSTSSGTDASLRVVGTGSWAVDVLGYVQMRNFSNVVISSTRFVPVLDQRNTPSTGLGGKIEVRPPIGDHHTLRIGADYRRSSGQLSELALSAFSGAVTARRAAGGRNSDLGVFVEDDWRSGDLTLTAGLRADRVSISDGFFRELSSNGAVNSDVRYADRTEWIASYRIGGRVRLADTLGVRAAGYTGLRLPTLNELYRPFTVFPVVTQANAELSTERLEGFEIGTDWRPMDHGRVSVTAFANRVRDAIANVTIAENLRQRRNVDAIAARGLEVDGSLEIDRWELRGSLALVDATVDASGPAAFLDGRRPAQTPRVSGSFSASHAIFDDGELSVTVRHIGDQFEDDLGVDELPGFTTISAYAAIPVLPNTSLVARIENLTDVDIVTRNQGGSIDLGVGRTIWLGFRWSANR
ncbi:TonB-dependent receptor plug domain-containing protein [Qipengyuania sp.]|uniref:TonB-dependent receptor plug domain-containing protein n=1 Tax=Qipengyuania sp. TaxID=2004515 RepID=UPI0035C7FACE